jgi:hypothetical protein
MKYQFELSATLQIVNNGGYKNSADPSTVIHCILENMRSLITTNNHQFSTTERGRDYPNPTLSKQSEHDILS